MKYQVFKSEISGTLKMIPSKSITHRVLISAALATGESIIENPLYADDTLKTLEILKSLGASFLTHLDHIKIAGGNIKHSNIPLFAKESGSTIRFLIPVALLTEELECFVLSPSLAKRPFFVYEELFKEHKIYFEKKDENIFIKGPISSGEYKIDGSVSSQFISGLLFVLPLLDGDSKLIIKNNFESKSYVDLTINVLKAFGIKINMNENIIFIKGNQRYKNTNYRVEGDYSQAAFHLTSAALGGSVTLLGLNKDSLQGDIKILEFLEEFGAKVTFKDNKVTVEKDFCKPVDINISDTPDLGPILFVLGALSKEKFTIRGIERLRYKESDRIKAMLENLDKVNAKYKLEENLITFYPSELKGGIEVSSHNDHRICMASTILASHLKEGLIIDGVESVNKSYPTFFEDFNILGGKYATVKNKD
ncbi:MAG: 3-phosphoshikimate 1-carboxyvinyltransferase [Acholeplasmatales bacterium]